MGRDETPDERRARTVDAATLRALAAGPQRVVGAPVSIVNAVVDEELDFSFATFEGELSFAGTRFEQPVDLEGARFKRHADFSGCHFATGVTFRAASADFDLLLLGARVSRGSFAGLTVGRRFDATRAEFGAEPGTDDETVVFANSSLRQAIFACATFHRDANFRGTRVELELDLRGALFRGAFNLTRGVVGGEVLCTPWDYAGEVRHTRFEGGAIFHRCTFRSLAWFEGVGFAKEALFHGCVFENDARFHRTRFDVTWWTGASVAGDLDFDHAEFGPASFDRIRVAADLLMTNSVFHQKASFQHASVGGEVVALGTRFTGRLDFSYARVSGAIYMEPSDGATVVAGEACFDWSVFDRFVNMKGMRFEGGASFVRMQVHDTLAFDGAYFGGEVSLRGAEVAAELSFSGATFQGSADFTELRVGRGAVWGPEQGAARQRFPHGAAFARARIGGDLGLSAVEFGGAADFAGVQVAGKASFLGSAFQAPVSFTGAQFADLLFREVVSVEAEGGQFGADVDLVGTRYARIGVAYGELLDHLSSESDEPFLFLEKALRSMANDRDADDVYRRMRRRNARRLRSRSRLRWLADLGYGAFAGYGLRPELLVYASLAVLALGTFVFQRPGAVMPSDPPAGERAAPTTISAWEAAGVSLHQFLPVEVPSGGAWKPSDEPITIGSRPTIAFRTYATFQTLWGFLLIPLFVGVVSGLLQRKRER
ncbi:MAG: pentapeptide repeat-containing protein [Longimicrobiaceae bacterium]